MKLILENFQSHQKTEVELAPRGELTVVTGPSDSGKTAIIRGLRWLFYNTPQGADFIRVGCNFARVTVELENGWKVLRTRTKSGSRNQYITLDPGGARQEYEGFGSSVPLEVQEILGIREVLVGDMDIKLNLAEQLDGPFLGSSVSAGARAKVLGKLAGTEEIDIASKSLGTDLYRAGQKEKDLSQRGEVLKATLEGYAWVEPLGETIAQLGTVISTIKIHQTRLKTLRDLQVRLQGTEERITRGYDHIKKYSGLAGAVEALRVVGQDEERRQRLAHLLARDVDTCSQMGLLIEKLLDLEKAEEAGGLLAVASKNLDRRNNCQNFRQRLWNMDQREALIRPKLTKLLHVNETRPLLTKLEFLELRFRQLTALCTKYSENYIKVVTAKAICEGYRGTEAAMIELENLQLTTSKFSVLRKAKATLEGIRQANQTAKGQAELAETTLRKAQGLYQKELQAIGQCPVCGAITDEFKLEEVI